MTGRRDRWRHPRRRTKCAISINQRLGGGRVSYAAADSETAAPPGSRLRLGKDRRRVLALESVAQLILINIRMRWLTGCTDTGLSAESRSMAGSARAMPS